MNGFNCIEYSIKDLLYDIFRISRNKIRICGAHCVPCYKTKGGQMKTKKCVPIAADNFTMFKKEFIIFGIGISSSYVFIYLYIIICYSLSYIL